MFTALSQGLVVFSFFTKWQADPGWQMLSGQRPAGSPVGRNAMYVKGPTLREGSQVASALRALSRCGGAVENSVFFLFTYFLRFWREGAIKCCKATVITWGKPPTSLSNSLLGEDQAGHPQTGTRPSRKDSAQRTVGDYPGLVRSSLL